MQDYIEESAKSIGHRASRIGKPDTICYTTSVVIPIICIFGVIGNIVCITVMTKYEKRSSYYTYLIVLSCSDLGNCLLLLMSSVSRGIENEPSNFYDLISIPLGCTFSGISVSATMSVTLDRLFLLWKPTRVTPPSMCTKIFARRIMLLSVFISIILNLPYYFVFILDENGRIMPTKFYYTRFYYVYNWFRFFIYGVIPSIFLTTSTILLIISLKRVKIQLRHLSCKSKSDNLDSSVMTISLIFILVFFLIGEVPGHFLSKKAAAVMLFGGDESSEFEETFQLCRKVASVLAALNISINFLLYFALHPPFRNGVRELLFGAKNETSNEPSKKTTETNESNDMKIDIFVVEKNTGGNVEKFKVIGKLNKWTSKWWNILN